MWKWLKRNAVYAVIAGFVLLLSFQAVQSSQTTARLRRDEKAAKINACNAVAQSNNALVDLLTQVLPPNKEDQAFIAQLDASFKATAASCLSKA